MVETSIWTQQQNLSGIFIQIMQIVPDSVGSKKEAPIMEIMNTRDP